MVLSDEDRVIVNLGRRLRAASAAEYERALRHLARSLMAAEIIAPNGARLVDLTVDSADELRFT